jgi:nucleoside-triphosphatase
MRLKGLAITGRPGVGKSTLFNEIVSELSKLGCRVGGISAPEVRASGRRLGFLIVDLESGEKGWLAKINYNSPIRVGRYGIVLNDVLRIGVNALKRALDYSDIIGIDEIGPMELKVPELRKAIVEALLSDKVKVVVFHRELYKRDPKVFSLVKELERIELTLSNRDLFRRKAPEYARWLANEASCNKGGEGVNMDR